jgi:hypothetical protein
MDYRFIYDSIVYFGYLVILLNTIVYFKSYRFNSVAFKIFSFYLLYCFIIQMTTSYLKNIVQVKNNLYMSHYYFIGQFVLLSFFYKSLLLKKAVNRMILFCLTLTLVGLAIFYILRPLEYYVFNISEILLTSIPIVVYSFLFFIQKFDKTDKKFLYLNSGVFFYILCSTLIFTAGNFVSSIKTNWYQSIWLINVSLYAVYQILIFIEWYKHFRKKEVPS